MKYEEKENVLKQYRYSKRTTMEARIKLEEIRLDQMYPKAIEYSDMPKGNVIGKDLSDYIVKLHKAELEVTSCVQAEEEKYNEVMSLINTLEDAEERYLLKLRYLKLSSWEYICNKLNYSKTQIHRLKRKAINNLLIKK